MQHTKGSGNLPLGDRSEAKVPLFLGSPLGYKLHSNDDLLQGAGHAVVMTLYSRAHRIGLEGVSCLLRTLCVSISLDNFLVVVLSVLACPALEFFIFPEQEL